MQEPKADGATLVESYGFDGDSPAPPHVSSEWNSLEECTEEWGLLTRLLLPSDKFTWVSDNLKVPFSQPKSIGEWTQC